MKKSLSSLLLGLALFSLGQCTTRDPIDEDHFFNLNNVLGGERPSQPIIESFDYPTDVVMKWSESIDPDSDPVDQPVDTYYVYFYLDNLPEGADLYAAEQREFKVEGTTSISFSDIIFPQGTNYLAVTGFDGGRESEISNIVSFVIE